jgi:23S rRNA pseudouridine2605 synthase
MQKKDGRSVRLNKFIAEQLAVGRRQADHFIEKGKVNVNGQAARLGQQIDPAEDVVTYDGKTLQAEVPLTYLTLNKPVGYVCSRKQQGDAPTIYSLLPEKYHHLKPVGRLDKDSSGLLLLTNDGDFAHRMTHPSFVKVKKYEVELDKPLEPLHRQMINDHGVQLDDGNSKLKLERLGESGDTKWRVTMHEGRNRQIRRTFEALGYTVTKLHRTDFGDYRLDNLAEKLFREL